MQQPEPWQPKWWPRLLRMVEREGLRPTARALGIDFATLYKWVLGTRKPNKLSLDGLAQRMKGAR